MGKSGRASKHSAKMKRKREMKAQRRAAYLSLAGTSKKSKNQRKRAGVASSGAKHAHKMSDCGNPGCLRCNKPKRPILNGYTGLGRLQSMNFFFAA